MRDQREFDKWEITTREEVEILLLLFEEADKREPGACSDVLEQLERGRRLAEEGFFDGK
ncbi:MAG: hypothetical protein LBP82_02920 [Candidatus Methanoplasma sp.]|nr:hypothetical protein [Candidatus Methanoplasma sp.]